MVAGAGPVLQVGPELGHAMPLDRTQRASGLSCCDSVPKYAHILRTGPHIQRPQSNRVTDLEMGFPGVPVGPKCHHEGPCQGKAKGDEPTEAGRVLLPVKEEEAVA